MFDPESVGKIPRNDIEVIRRYPSVAPKFQAFQAIVTLQSNRHHVIFKPNPDGCKDQIVADRLKYLFGLQPMYSACASLNFAFQHDDLIDLGGQMNYLMFAFRGEFEPLVDFDSQPDAIKVEVYKIIMFRFMIGFSRGHIGMIRGMPVSISESLSTAILLKRFVSTYIHPGSDLRLKRRAQIEFREHFDNDYMRGIIVTCGKPVKELKGLRPKGPLSQDKYDIAMQIETRWEHISNCDVTELVSIMTLS